MPMLNTLAVFGLGGSLVATSDEQILSAEDVGTSLVNPNTLKLAQEHLRNANYVLGFISPRSNALHTATRSWLNVNLNLTAYPKPSYLMLRDTGSTYSPHTTQAQNLATLLSAHPEITKVVCYEGSEDILKHYKILLERSQHIWRLFQVNGDSLSIYASSFISFE